MVSVDGDELGGRRDVGWLGDNDFMILLISHSTDGLYGS